MRHPIEGFVEQSNALLQRSMPFTMLCRDSSLQEVAIGEIEQWLKQIAEKKDAAKANREDDIANMLLSVACALGSVHSCLQMCLQLKRDQPHEAWKSLVRSQQAARASLRAHHACNNMVGLCEFLNDLEACLFPPQVFASIGASFSEACCSICDTNYGSCEHIAGRPYAGEFCSMVIRNSLIEEVSIVDFPEDKLCIVTSMSDGEGKMVDRLSLVPVETEKDTESKSFDG